MNATVEATAVEAVRKGRPTIRERARDKICPNCGGQVERKSARGPFPTYCTDKCKKDFGNRQLVEGRAIIGFVKAWRIDRAQGEIAQGSFAQICQIVDHFNAMDREANRPRADLWAAKVLVDQTMYFDRQKRG